MKHLLILVLLCVLFVPGARADEAIDSGWVELTPSEMKQGYDAPRLTFVEVSAVERNAIHTDALSVVKMVFDVKNKVDYTLYFDIDVLALDDRGQMLFAMKVSPDLFGLGGGATESPSQTRHVLPGTLERMAAYKCRFLGFR